MTTTRGALVRLSAAAALLTFVMLLGGCASVKVTPESKTSARSAAIQPTRLIVGQFTFADDAAQVTPKEFAAVTRMQRELPVVLRTELAKALKPLGYVATTADAARPRNVPAWLISGQFSKVDRGSRFLRVGIGFGAGASQVETKVQVDDLSSRRGAPVATFRTTSFSGGDPGLITSIGITPVEAINAAVTLASTVGRGPTDDTKRTARMIAAYVSELLAERGWLDPKLVRRAKK